MKRARVVARGRGFLLVMGVSNFYTVSWFRGLMLPPVSEYRSELMLKGTVKWFNTQKGYGFITREDGDADAFVHISAVEQSGLTSLAEGQQVEFDLAPGRNGKMAAQDIRILD